MDLRYVNSKGVELNLTQWPYMYSSGDVYNFVWKYRMAEMNSYHVSEFYKEPVEVPIKISITADTRDEFVDALDRLYETIETDVVNMIPGKLYVGDMYINCYIYGSKKAKFNSGIEFMFNELRVVSENPFWIRESKIAYERKQASDTGYLDYPYDYPYDYSPNDMAVYLENTEVMPADFKMVIQGPCENPQVTIGQNKCQIMTTLSSYEYIVLNSMDRTIYKVSSTGTVTNVFESLNRNYENFDKIPQGNHIISINGTFKMEITMYMKRSEPRWT